MAELLLKAIRISAMLAIFLSAVATGKLFVIVLAIAVIWYYLDWVRADETKERSFICPECASDSEVEQDEVEVGGIVNCPECGTEFEVVALEPLELTPVENDDEEEADGEVDDYYEPWPASELE